MRNDELMTTYRWSIDGQEWTSDPELGDGPELDGCEVEVIPEPWEPALAPGRVVDAVDPERTGVVVEISDWLTVLARLGAVRPVGWREMSPESPDEGCPQCGGSVCSYCLGG